MFKNQLFSMLSYFRKCVLRLMCFAGLVFILCGLPVNCASNINQQPQSLAPLDISIAKDINVFSWNYFNQLSKESIDDNGVISPQSIYDCLAMSYIASGGQTRQQLAAAIGFPQNNQPLLDDMRKLTEALNMKFPKEASVMLSNGVWLDKTYAKFQTNYVKQLQESFMAEPKEIRFANSIWAANEINSWVSQKTRGKINNIITPDDLKSKSSLGITNEPGLVLVNAVYFYSQWASGFDKKETQPRPFKMSGGQRQVETMHQFGELGYDKREDYAVLRLRYKHVPFSMYIVLPDKVMTARALVEWAGNNKELRNSIPRTRMCNVDVLLPKFSLTSQYDVKKQLMNMGVLDAFAISKADFGKMIIKTPKADRIYISAIRQKATIDLNEEGTEATAATCSVSYSIACAAPHVPEIEYFHADHPFVYMIVHDPSSTILFNGWVSNP